MVSGVTSGGTVGVIAMTALRYAQTDADVIMPVRRSQAVYANFKHIQVRPDSTPDEGVPLYKLKILDSLIDQLSQKKPLPAVDAGSIDSVITNISRGLRGPAGSDRTYRTGFLPAPGAFVDLVA
jgi:hypothetical protein